MKICALLFAAVTTAAAAAPKTPAVDSVAPAAVQPFSSDPDVIWYDSFDDPAFPSRYFEFSAPESRFGPSTEHALGGAGGSLRGLFSRGTVSAGSLKLAFGDNPAARIVARKGEKFQEVYWRIYVKHQRGWIGNPAKLSRATILAGPNWSQAMIGHVWGGQGNLLTLDPASGTDQAGLLKSQKYNDFENLRWLGNQPPAGFPIFSSEESGKWVCVEAAVKLNTPGESDGTFALWIDGRLDSFRDGLNWRGSWDERGLNAVFLENYWNNGSPVEQARYFDDFVVSTKPIGLSRCDRNPEILLTPFEAGESGDTQSAMQVQVGIVDGSDIVWDSGIRKGPAGRIRVDAEQGRFRGSRANGKELNADTRYAVRVRQQGRTGGWSDWSAWRIVIQTE